MATTRRTLAARAIEYPTSDGRPMAETDFHRDLMVDLIDTLGTRYEAEPDVYVSGNLLVYYEKGNPRKRLAPDVFLVRGVPKGSRENFLIWEEGKAPDVAIELTSRKTRFEDSWRKFPLYRDVLKVPEYFLFDPLEDYLRPSMRGFRLVAGNYEPIAPVEDRLRSDVLGCDLIREGWMLRLIDRATGRRLPRYRSFDDIATHAQRAERAQAELAQLRREMERLRGGGA